MYFVRFNSVNRVVTPRVYIGKPTRSILIIIRPMNKN